MREGDPAHVRNAKIGIVFQSFHLIPTLTARENVGMPFYIIGLTKSLLGAAADVGLSILLVDVAGDVVTLFINWQFSPELRGGVTTVLFAANANLQASDVRPMHVFRQLPVPTVHVCAPSLRLAHRRCCRRPDADSCIADGLASNVGAPAGGA